MFNRKYELSKLAEMSVKVRQVPEAVDFSKTLSYQIDRILQLAAHSNSNGRAKGDCIESINWLEDVLYGWWTDGSKCGKEYITNIEGLSKAAEEEKIKDQLIIAHLKFRYLMKLAKEAGFQGTTKSFGYGYPANEQDVEATEQELRGAYERDFE